MSEAMRNWRENTDDPIVRWLRQVENYYRDQYPNSMYLKVRKILPSRYEVLRVLFDELTSLYSAQFRTVPDKKQILKALDQVYEGYPEFSAGSYNRQIEDQTNKLPEPDLEAEVERERRRQKEEQDHDPLQEAMNREHVRVRNKKGNRTKYEGWWLWCMEERGGKYTAMPPDWTRESYDEKKRKQGG